MLVRFKSQGAESNSGGGPGKRGHKGRLELVAAKKGEKVYSVAFKDYGSFGKLRGWGDFGDVTKEELLAMSDALRDLANDSVESTGPSEEALHSMLAEEKLVRALQVAVKNGVAVENGDTILIKKRVEATAEVVDEGEEEWVSPPNNTSELSTEQTSQT